MRRMRFDPIPWAMLWVLLVALGTCIGVWVVLTDTEILEQPIVAAQETHEIPKPDSLPKADVTVEGPQRVAPGRLAAFTLRGLPSQYVAAFDWIVFNRPDDATVLDMADRKTGAPVLIFQSDIPGRYAVIADVNVEPLADCTLIVHEFTVGDPEPEPQPEPEPEPEPLPPAEELFGIVVEESSDRIQERDGKKVNFGLIIRSERVSKLFGPQKFIVVDKDGKQTPPDWKPYLDRAVEDKRRLPWLYLVNEKGEVLYDGPLPATVTGAVTKIKEFKAE